MTDRGKWLTMIAMGVSVAACNTDSTGTLPPANAPSVLTANTLVSGTVGSALVYDASRGGTTFSDPVGSGLKYTITFSGVTGGLNAVGSVISGTPTTPGVINATLTATDALGRSATDQFAIVLFAPALASPALPAQMLRYADGEVGIPSHFLFATGTSTVASTDNLPAGNAITDAGATLGRVLFYDTRLSADDGTSCASCHVQATGFGDRNPLSVGFAGGLTGRHSPALANARYYKRGRFFWDERAINLETQVLGPIQNTTEMGMTLDALVLKLTATPFYSGLFNAAFGSPIVTSDRISLALSQFVRSLVSGGSRYDKAFSANGVANFAGVFTADEQAGEALFRSRGCAACHTTLAQVADSIHNIGLDAANTDAGAGNGAFKVSSLRNVAVRTRYMHDGRFSTLEQVVDFFNAGVQPNPNLDPRLKSADGTPLRLGLTVIEKQSLVAFLRTLTDSTFLGDARFSNPFVGSVVTPTPPAPPTGTASPSAATVTMQGKAYHPPTITVAPGAVITFTNLDNTQHSAQFDNNSIASTVKFVTGSRTVTMPAATGTYTYHCAVHGLSMSGEVTVK